MSFMSFHFYALFVLGRDMRKKPTNAKMRRF